MQQCLHLQNLNKSNNLEQPFKSDSSFSPSQSLQKQQRNFCLPSQLQQNPIQSSIRVQFQRYGVKNNNNIKKINQLKKQIHTSSEAFDQSINKTLLTSQCYKDWKIYKNKSDLNMLPFPYCIDQSFEFKKMPFSPLSLLNSAKIPSKQPLQQGKKLQKQLPRLYKLKIENKVRVYNENLKQNKVYRPYFNYEKTPINEYLNYELTQQINMGLRQVQIAAEQIRRIKKDKKMVTQNVVAQKQKFTKGLRIRKSYVKNYKGLYKNQC